MLRGVQYRLIVRTTMVLDKLRHQSVRNQLRKWNKLSCGIVADAKAS
jgi:hypothetical protein